VNGTQRDEKARLEHFCNVPLNMAAKKSWKPHSEMLIYIGFRKMMSSAQWFAQFNLLFNDLASNNPLDFLSIIPFSKRDD
jgi:hypothetical protein